MNWKVIVGRGLTASVAVAMLVFGIMGYTPTWWEGVIAMMVPIANFFIGKWSPPK